MEKTLHDVGERAVIEALQRLFGNADNAIVGIGDDCAVVSSPSDSDYDIVLTSDAVISGVHFTRDTPPRHAGRKAMARALSDLGAMGAVPAWALVDLVSPGSTHFDDIKELGSGIANLARAYGVSIIGGDTARGSALEIHVFAVGTVPHGTAVLRSSAVPGQFLFVTGLLGMSIAGKHITFEPRVREGIWLRENGFAASMIDISDGIATDLHHLSRMSHVGAIIEASAIPLSDAAMTDKTSDPVSHALYDGEDYELLFSVEPDKSALLMSQWHERFDTQLTRIGIMTDNAGVVECRTPDGTSRRIEPRGYSHFTGE